MCSRIEKSSHKQEYFFGGEKNIFSMVSMAFSEKKTLETKGSGHRNKQVRQVETCSAKSK